MCRPAWRTNSGRRAMSPWDSSAPWIGCGIDPRWWHDLPVGQPRDGRSARDVRGNDARCADEHPGARRRRVAGLAPSAGDGASGAAARHGTSVPRGVPVERGRRQRDSRRARPCGDAHRLGPRGQPGGRAGGSTPEEDRARAGWQRSVSRARRCRPGASRPDRGRGAFYPPTVLVAVEPGMPAFDQETFGPVAAVIRAKDEADAIGMANASPYGLGAAVWTGDPKRGERVARELEAGSVFVNGLVKSDPRLPFGGVKRSGFGRELSEYGLREFVNVKTVWVA